jgi:HPt (histidine-containing phosphotransfer) domain-containing protein
MPLHKLLLVDATVAVRARLAQAFPDLEKGGGLLTATKADAVRRAETDRPDVILVEDAATAHELIGALTQRKALARFPVIQLAQAGADGAEGAAAAASCRLDPAALATQIRSVYAEVRLAGQLARLEELGGDSFVSEMIGLFLETTPQRLQAARDGLSAADLEAVEHAVHSLKSSAGNLGADEVQDLAGRLETLAAARSAEPIPALFQQLETAVARIEARLSRVQTAPK